jgi:hypothetical protein
MAEKERLQNEIKEKIPKLVNQSIEKVENEWTMRLMNEKQEMKSNYEYQINRLKHIVR